MADTKPETKKDSVATEAIKELRSLAAKIAAKAGNARERNVGALFVEAIDKAVKGKKFKDFARFNVKLNYKG